MNTTNKELERELSRDPLDEAERATGQSYKEDELTQAMGFMRHMQRGEKLQRMLSERGDSTFSMSLADYQRVIADEGFELVKEFPFTESREQRQEKFFVYVLRRDGVLLAFDTSGTTRVNGGHFYYNIRPHDHHNFQCRSSGYFTDEWIWVGDHDCREAIRFKLSQLREHGTFISPWRERAFPWLSHYGDGGTDRDVYKSIELRKRASKERVAALPPDIISMIGPDKG